MSFLSIILLFLAALAVLVVVAGIIWAVGTQRRLVSADEKCANSLSQIGVQLNSRWDAITSLVNLTRKYAAHEAETLLQVVAARQPVSALKSPSDITAQEKQIGLATRQLVALGESYPELKAESLFAKTLDSVNRYEDQVRMSRMVFNDSVTKYNRLVRELPSSLLASIFGYQVRPYFESDGEKRELPQ